jgi:hypothetical protein
VQRVHGHDLVPAADDAELLERLVGGASTITPVR